jgi:hypothetical protein
MKITVLFSPLTWLHNDLWIVVLLLLSFLWLFWINWLDLFGLGMLIVDVIERIFKWIRKLVILYGQCDYWGRVCAGRWLNLKVLQLWDGNKNFKDLQKIMKFKISKTQSLHIAPIYIPTQNNFKINHNSIEFPKTHSNLNHNFMFISKPLCVCLKHFLKYISHPELLNKIF